LFIVVFIASKFTKNSNNSNNYAVFTVKKGVKKGRAAKGKLLIIRKSEQFP